MQIMLNDEAKEVNEGTSVLDLVEEMGKIPEEVTITVNGVMVLKEKLYTPVKEGDAVEILFYFVGGAN